MAANSFYRTPRLTTFSFAAGVLLFLLPFAEIKCNGASFAQMSGLNLATGSSPKLNNGLDNMFDSFDQSGMKRTEKTSGKSDGKLYPFALIALLLGVVGVAVSLTKKSVFNQLEMILGAAGAVALIVLLVQVKSDASSQLKSGNPNADSLNGMMKVSVEFTAWFFLCVLAYLASAFFSYKQKELATAGDLPPGSAPQVPVQNPGDQSNFPAAPSGEQDLG